MSSVQRSTAQASGGKETRSAQGTLFDDLTVAQVVAGALAAVTSMLLSSQIGIAGSVIGVAAGSVVSTISSQLYKKFLAKTGEKIKSALPDALDDQQEAPSGQEHPDNAHRDSLAGTEQLPDVRQASPIETPTALEAQPTMAFGAAAGTTQPIDAVGAPATADPRLAVRIARRRRERKRRQRVQTGVIAVSIVSALIAVAVSAGAINLFTGGDGIGTKPDSLFLSANDTSASRAASGESVDAAPLSAANQESPSSEAEAKEDAPGKSMEEPANAAADGKKSASDGETAGTDASQTDPHATDHGTPGSGSNASDSKPETESDDSPASGAAAGSSDGSVNTTGGSAKPQAA